MAAITAAVAAEDAASSSGLCSWVDIIPVTHAIADHLRPPLADPLDLAALAAPVALAVAVPVAAEQVVAALVVPVDSEARAVSAASVAAGDLVALAAVALAVAEPVVANADDSALNNKNPLTAMVRGFLLCL